MNKFLAAFLTLFILAGCTKKLEVVAVDDSIQVQHPAPPPQILWKNIGEIKVLTVETLEEIMSDPNVVLIVFTPKGYENLALNIRELKRYIEEQKEIIIYYMKVTTPKKQDD